MADQRIGGGRLRKQRTGNEDSTPTHNWGDRPRSRIPERVKQQVRRRDKTCRLQYPGVCTGRIEEMDHIIGLAELGIPRTPVLDAADVRGVCIPCHAIRSEQQRRAGVERANARRAAQRHRPDEPHPGQLP